MLVCALQVLDEFWLLALILNRRFRFLIQSICNTFDVVVSDGFLHGKGVTLKPVEQTHVLAETCGGESV